MFRKTKKVSGDSQESCDQTTISPLDGVKHSASSGVQEIRAVVKPPTSKPTIRLKVIFAGCIWLLLTISTSLFFGYIAGLRSQLAPILAKPPADSTMSWSQLLASAAAPSIVSISASAGELGTGFFYSSTQIITASHVVLGDPQKAAINGDKQVIIRTSDGTSFSAVITGADPKLDIAVLTAKIPSEQKDKIHPLVLGDYLPALGSQAAVLGYPYGKDLMITTGVVSGILTNSPFAIDPAQQMLLSTNAAVNPGVSGSPLLSPDGMVLGVVTLRPDTFDNRPVEGIALAVPSALLAPAIAALTQGTTPQHVTIGVVLQNTSQGVMVTKVLSDSPAANASIKTGDLILKADGKEVKQSVDLPLYLAQADSSINVLLQKANGQKKTVTIKLTSK